MAQAPSPNPSTSRSYAYGVYLSFRCEDTRWYFTTDLYLALGQAGFLTFIDDHKLEVEGVDIKPELQKAIYESRSSVIVFSKKYASSTWCLDELVMILECRRKYGQFVLPVYYDINPSELRRQGESLAEAFARYDKRQSLSKINGWRAALAEVADLAGMVLQNEADRHEARFINKIVRVIEDRLVLRSFSVSPFTIGVDSRAEKINLWLQDGSADVGVRMICGMRGVGKTTIAKYVYDLHFHRFEGSSFLENMRETSQQVGGLVKLQKKLLHDIHSRKVNIQNESEGMSKITDVLGRRRVLLVLDDVDDIHQLVFILGLRNSICPGSKIIITTTNVGLSKGQLDSQCHVVETLDYNESLELFSWHAFGQDHPFERYMELSNRTIDHCRGLPSALSILGSSLAGKSIDVWESVLQKLEVIPNGEITSKLKLSYDSLQDSHDKNLFLHIACFFIGKNADTVVRILDGCGFFTAIGLENLIDRCLVTIDENNKVCMHPMIRDMGREIVRLESREPQERSRLWHHKNCLEVLTRKNGTDKIEGLVLNMHKKNNLVLKTNAFRGMHRLSLLRLSNVRLNGSYEKFPRRLSWLCWLGFPLDCIPTDISLERLVVLEMHYSSLKHVWKGRMFLPSLKILDVSHSHDLVEVGDFSQVCNLERLILKDCRSLVGIHESIGVLEKLVYLNMEDCKSINKFPTNKPKSLETIITLGCSNPCEFRVTETRRMKLFEVDEAQVKSLFTGAAKSGLSRSDFLKLHLMRESQMSMQFIKSLMRYLDNDAALSHKRRLSTPKLGKPTPKLNCAERESLPEREVVDEGFIIMNLIRSIMRYLDNDAALRHKHRLSTPKLGKPTPKLNCAERESLPERLEVVDDGSTIMKGDNVDLEDKRTLTPSLKQLLFLYCSLFPLDYEFKKYELVQLWIAQGFIGETQKETMEDTGISYFTSLENEGYFVPSRRDFSVNFDSLFSLPIYNTSNFLYKVNATKLSVLDKRIDGGNYFQAVNVGQLCGASESLTKHLSLKISESNDEMTYGVVQKFKKLHTLLLFSSSVSSVKHVPRDLFLSLHELRTLNLSRALISGLPSSIGEARQLRYLDVSYTPITQLPESVSSLHQLQTLKLRGCVHFSMLPRATKNLTNLRHIELDIILQLDAMPTYLGNLTNLQTLSAFLVGTDDGCRINELKNLNDLKGALGISGLENIASKEEAEEAALLNKKYLQRLNLRWSNVMADEKSDEEKLTVQNKEKTMYTEDEVILESLRPPNGLKELQIEHYAGSVLPSWVSDPIFADLAVITLYRCKHCTLVPALGLLPGLKSLSIIEMNAVEEINQEFFRNDGVNDQSLQAFPKLEMLEIDIMLNLKDWKGIQIGDLPVLHKLTVKSCPELVTIPSVSILKSLKHLEFRRCPKLPSLPNDGLPTSLESFIIKDCPQLEKSCLNVKREDWSKICCVPNVWLDDEEIISQGSSEKDSDDVVTTSREDDVQSAADEELMQCLEILNNMEEIDDDSYSKALKFFHGEISWRKVFVHMAEKRRKGFILNL